jgi:hypothetical protein
MKSLVRALLILIGFVIVACPPQADAQVVVVSTPIPYNPNPPGPPIAIYGDAADNASAKPYQAFQPAPKGVYKLFMGIVSSFTGWQLKFVDGRTVYLDKQTIIDPTGATIRRGMQIAVHGYFRATGGITARYIVIQNGDGKPH